MSSLRGVAKPLSFRARFLALERDNFRCCYCRGEPGNAGLEVDHIIPRSLGGSSHPLNLAAACRPCNRGKGSRIVIPGDGAKDDEGWKVWRQGSYWKIIGCAGNVVLECKLCDTMFVDYSRAHESDWDVWMDGKARLFPKADRALVYGEFIGMLELLRAMTEPQARCHCRWCMLG